MKPRRVVVVGAGLAGARVAETLRARGFDGDVVLLGAEPVAPYERPALSKEYLAGTRRASQLALRPPGFWPSRAIELRLGEPVVGVDYGRRVVVTCRGAELAWDALVLATGARARRLPIDAPGAHSLRTLADAAALRRELAPGRRLLLIGGGFVGAEVASTASALGLEVAVLEAGPAPLARQLGDQVGTVLAARYREHGIELHTNASVRSIERGPTSKGVVAVLGDGRRVPADTALVAVGVEPERTLLPPCPVQAVYACGDVAGAGHWTSAAHDAVAVAHRILGLEPPPAPPPYVWSDQLGLRLQLVGAPGDAADVELEGSEGSFAARYRRSDGRLVAALLANRPDEVAGLRRELAFAA